MPTHARQARQLVVHHGGHVELEELHVLRDDVGRRAVLLIAPELIVDLHDVGQFVGQVILREEVRTVTTQLREHSPQRPHPTLRQG